MVNLLINFRQSAVKCSALHNSLEISMGYPFIYQKLGKAVE
jgi:hypothetical protein